jgi:hypothetical protein
MRIHKKISHWYTMRMVEKKYEETREISANQHNFLAQHLKYHVNVFANTVPNKKKYTSAAGAGRFALYKSSH